MDKGNSFFLDSKAYCRAGHYSQPNESNSHSHIPLPKLRSTSRHVQASEVVSFPVLFKTCLEKLMLVDSLLNYVKLYNFLKINVKYRRRFSFST